MSPTLSDTLKDSLNTPIQTYEMSPITTINISPTFDQTLIETIGLTPILTLNETPIEPLDMTPTFGMTLIETPMKTNEEEQKSSNFIIYLGSIAIVGGIIGALFIFNVLT